ncbi:Lrp/AsnC family transcriptional regulator [candidate division KSB1 bacterium]|nr:MAG: Lrp/AsnC family transcriptional regulator [candidate division KSB1 bacterium]
MDVKFSKHEIQLIRLLQEDIPLTPRPFAEIAKCLHTDEQGVLRTIQTWQRQGVIRRFGAILSHRRAGFTANGMSVWVVPEERIDEVGEKLASFPEVSHCYHRPPFPGWPYNLFAMIHGKSREEVEEIAAKITEAIGIAEYKILYSQKELKKTSMKYFAEKSEGNSFPRLGSS